MNKVEVIPVWDMNNEEWLEARKGGIGGSDAGTIVGVNKYKSAYALWGEKTNIMPTEFTGNDATDWGHDLERPIAAHYARKHNKAVVEWPVILRSLEEGREFMFANLDFLIVEPSDEFPVGVVSWWRFTTPPPNVLGILEVKTAGIASPGNPGAWAYDNIPESYMLQGYHYGIVAGFQETPKITFAALIGGQGLQVREMEWNQNIADNLVIAEAEFWEQVVTKTAPPTDGSEATEAAQRQRYPRHEEGKFVEAELDLLALIAEFEAAKEEADAADAKRKALRAQIVEFVGDAESAKYNGSVLLTYKAGKEVESLDADRIKKEAPEIWEQYKKVRPGARTLRINSK
jgi:putative phage-type endonuclease